MSLRIGFFALLLAFSLLGFAKAKPIDVKAGENRPFLISDGTGAYLYGSTGDDWDQGWMGLWINQERVFFKPQFLDTTDTSLSFDNASCTVNSNQVVWKWGAKGEQTVMLQLQGNNIACRAKHVKVAANEWVVFVGLPVYLDTNDLPMHDGSWSKLIGFVCEDRDLASSVEWSNANLRHLLAENSTLLYAGIPWFNEGWGRDTFISLPGFLVTGHHDIAKKLLMRFAGWIDRDPNSPTYGRIPNRVRPGEDIAYNTADGTPWWMREVYEYGMYSGDYALWDTLLAENGAMRIALDAAVARSDSLGFLMHGDADTWMDAVGLNGPHTPRGNRAIEIQALHYTALDNATRMTKNVNEKWRETAETIRRNFLANYLAPSHDHFYDRLMADGTPDTTMRPNQMFAFTAPYTQLLPPQLEETVTKSVASELFYEHGVLSLSPTDTCFHPFHMDWHYPKDDAYHQGIVWVWNSGPAKTLLIRQGRGDLALKMTEYESWHMRERGMVGSLPELFDAVKRPENKFINYSGTTSQAWSLAEFLRSIYQDFLGIRPVILGRVDPFWLFAPRIPEEWGEVQTRVICSGTQMQVRMQQFSDSTVIELQAETTPKNALPVKFFDVARGITGAINTTDPLRVVYRHKDGYMLVDDKPTAQLKLTGWPYDLGPQDLKFAPPIKKLDFASLKDPDWKILTGKDIHCDTTHSKLLVQKSDPVGDEAYTYPTDENFRNGILDLTQFQIRETKNSYRFEFETEKLAQPGWHPEYGFQLTYAAICLHTKNALRTAVGANSNMTLDTPFERIVYVGGGVRVENDSGKIVGEFVPRENSDAFGDVVTSTISFCLPKSLFPKRDESWEWTVLCGAQDDHGGAGIGEFRSVGTTAERWSGGGNTRNGSNVYDRLSTLGH